MEIPCSVTENYSGYRQEWSPKWEKGDRNCNEFFAYLLEMNDGSFYAGHTRALRERIWEQKNKHSDRQPNCVWFDTFPTRDEASLKELRLKKLIKKDPRKIRTMVLSFKDLVSTLEYRR